MLTEAELDDPTAIAFEQTMPYSDNMSRSLRHAVKSGLDQSPGAKPLLDVYPNESSHNRALNKTMQKVYEAFRQLI